MRNKLAIMGVAASATALLVGCKANELSGEETTDSNEENEEVEESSEPRGVMDRDYLQLVYKSMRALKEQYDNESYESNSDEYTSAFKELSERDIELVEKNPYDDNEETRQYFRDDLEKLNDLLFDMKTTKSASNSEDFRQAVNDFELRYESLMTDLDLEVTRLNNAEQ